MDILHLVIGLLMVALGFLVKSQPGLIAGYNTLPRDKQKNVDIDGLSSLVRNGLIGIGAAIIVGYYLLKWIGFNMIANLVILIVTLVGVTILALKARKFDHNKTRKPRIYYFIPGLILLFVTGLIVYGFIPSNVIYSTGAVRFSGLYGFEIGLNEIDKLELTDSLAAIQLRTNGFSLGPVRKGFFMLDKLGRCRLLIQSNSAPYLIISDKNGDKALVNFKERAKTIETYEKLKSMTGN